MTGPLVSIILPTYNGAKYIAASIESCLQQTYSNIELIIVDDCSADATPAIIRSFADNDKRITVIRNEKNKKLPLSLNTGFEQAKGVYFTWTSDDNYYAPHAIEEMVKTLEAQPEAGLVYCNYTTIDGDGKITGVKLFGDVNENMVAWAGCGACFLYRAALQTLLKGYDASAFLIEDYDFFIRALTKVKFIYDKRTDLYFYRFHAGSLTSLYGFYIVDLQKIVIERQLSALLQVAGKKDQARWFRKFTVYYGVSKNNTGRMHTYLQRLYGVSKSQALITWAYIISRKVTTGIRVSIAVTGSLLRAVFGTRNNKNNN